MRHRETIVTPRAGRMLLRIHYLRVLGPPALVCFGTLLLFFAASMFSRVMGLRHIPPQALDLTALLLSLLVALPVGAAVFSRPFKEQHVVLFHALPVSRLRQWVVLSSASLLALLTIYAGFALIRPGAFTLLRNGVEWFGLIVGICFAAGLCFSLVAVRPVIVYMTAYVAAILAPILVGIAMVAPYFALDAPGPQRSASELLALLAGHGRSLPAAAPWIAGAAIIVLFLTASALFYVRGEMTLTRVQLRNGLLAYVAILALAIVTTPLIYALAGGRRGWVPHSVSPDGRTFATRHSPADAPWKTRVDVHDLETGSSVSRQVDGVLSIAWNEKHELMIFVRDISPWRRLWYFRPPRDRVQRWSMRGEKLGEVVLDGVMLQNARLDDRHHVVLMQDRGVARLIQLENGASPRKLLELRAPSVWAFGPGVLGVNYLDGEPRAWRIAPNRAEEIRRAPVASEIGLARVWIFDDVFYLDRDALLRKIESTWPAPRDEGDRAGYVFFENSRWVYAVVGRPSADGKLYVLDGATKRWKLISERIPLAPNELPRVETSFYDLSTAASTSIGPTLALFTERSDGKTVYRLYDPALDTTATFFERSGGDRRAFNMHARKAGPPEGVRLSVTADLEPIREALWRDGRVSVIPTFPGGALVAMWPDGTQVRAEGGSVTVVNEKGVLRRIAIEPK